MSARDVLLDEFWTLAGQLGDDELDMAVEGARRLLMGRKAYGELVLKLDGRDPLAEASPELADYFVYRNWDALKKQRANVSP
jgi:hypothetical protein